ncbi:MAG: DNA-binding MarR family transcriptional regulator [Paracoccaceae bacterium]|jgi:DNA-binding MarR family transcriptional regulator
MTYSDDFDGPEILRDNVPYLTHRISMLMYQAVDPYLKEQDISLEMCRVLFMLSEVGHHNLVALSEATSVKTSTLSRLVGRMVQRGLVSRSRSDTDNRTVNVAILPPGQEMIDILMPRMSEIWEMPRDGFSPEELPILTSYLRRLLHTVAKNGAKNGA